MGWREAVTQLFGVSKDEKIACLKREIDKRLYFYPRRVVDGKMSKQKADRETEIMRAILADYLQSKQP